MEPLVSVIMSTLNTKEEYLIKSINSILNQTYRNFEFIIIVDSGNDNEIIEKINDKRIKIIIHQEKRGLAKSLNEAIEVAKGKYIARMDSDDISVSDRLKVQVEYMEKNQDIDMTSTFYQQFGKSHRVVKESFIKSNYVASKMYYINPICHPAVMFKREFLIKNNIRYDENYIYSQDFELWNRIRQIGKITIIPKIELNYRIHNAQISTDKFKTQSELYYKILERNLEELHIDKENLKYILMLNSRKTDIDIKGLDDFIKLSINKNEELNIYDKKSFKKILKTAFIAIMIKRKKVFSVEFIKNFRYLFLIIGSKINNI